MVASFFLLQFAGAVRAAGSFQRDLAEAVGAFLGGGGSGSSRLLADAHQLVHATDQAEQHEGGDDEVDHRGQEGRSRQTPGPGHTLADLARGAGHDQVQQRVNEIGRQGSHNAGERAANDNADGHIQHIAAQSKLFEILKELFHG